MIKKKIFLNKKNKTPCKGNNQQNSKTTYWVGKAICKWHIQALASKIYKNWYNSTPINQIIQLKMNRRPCLQRRHTDGQQIHEKMFNITNQQGNANQNHNKLSAHTCQNDWTKNKKTTSIGEDVEKKEPLTLSWECKLVQPLWNMVWRFLKKLKIKLPHDSTIPLIDIYPKNTKTLIQKHICTPLFITVLFTIAKLWK